MEARDRRRQGEKDLKRKEIEEKRTTEKNTEPYIASRARAIFLLFKFCSLL